MTRTTTTPPSLAPRGSDRRYRDRIYDDPRHDPYQAKGKYRGTRRVQRLRRGVPPRPLDVGRGARGRSHGGMPGLPPDTRQAARRLRHARGRSHAGRARGARASRANVEKHEKAEHPLHRIIAIEQDADEMRVTTTDAHLPQRIGEAVKHARKGTLEIIYGHDEYVVRVHWHN